MKTKILPDLNYLKECFELDPASPSYLRWSLNRPRSHFKNLQAFSNYKNSFAGKPIINETTDGYYYLHVKPINDKLYSIRLHRIVYAIYNNTIDFEGKHIDHINGNGKDNNPKNLRLATRSQNQQNRSIQKNNKIGHKNIRYHNSCKKFTVQFGLKNKIIYIGSYSTIEEAIAARDLAGKQIAGEFYRTI